MTHLELIFNLCWLLIGVAGCGLWLWFRYHFGAIAQRHPYVWMGCVALACALAVLFPSISVTDDLHSEWLVMEEWSASRGKSIGSDKSTISASPHPVAPRHVLFNRALVDFDYARMMERVEGIAETPYSDIPIDLPISRAPPLSFS